VATLIAFAFCALSFREQPFKTPRLNHVKIFSEFQVYGILLVCLITQVDEQGFESEFVTIGAYGVMQTTLMVAIVPVVLYFMVTTFRGLKTKVKDDMDKFSHRHDHHHVSEAKDHTVIAKIQDEKARLCERPDENARSKKQGQCTQHDDNIAVLKESVAKLQAENAKKDAELRKLQAENAMQRAQLVLSSTRFSSRQNDQQVSVAQNHDEIVTLQNENTRLREQEHVNADQLLVLLQDVQPPKPHELASAVSAPRAASPQRKPTRPTKPARSTRGMAEQSALSDASPSPGLVHPRPWTPRHGQPSGQPRSPFGSSTKLRLLQEKLKTLRDAEAAALS
jgi:hypothetical protein